MNSVYHNEIISPISDYTTDGKTDYGYAGPQEYWEYSPSEFADYHNQCWLYRGLDKWTITRSASNTSKAIYIDYYWEKSYYFL